MKHARGLDRLNIDRDKTFVIYGPYGKGHPYYEAGYLHGLTVRPAVMREDDTYINGWSDGYRASRPIEHTDRKTP